jgi:endonuclease YncB( thermonuclease family)
MSDIRNLPLSTLPKVWRAADTAEDPNHFKYATVSKVIDGDSVWMFIDLDFDDIYARRNCRLIGIDAPDAQPGKEASRAWLAERLWPGRDVYLYLPDNDKYGRPLAGVYLGLSVPSLNTLSLEAGMSVPYFGGPR